MQPRMVGIFGEGRGRNVERRGDDVKKEGRGLMVGVEACWHVA